VEHLLPVALVMAAAMAYEVAEWLAVAMMAGGGEAAQLLGAQGDLWDAQMDMALAALGAMAAMTLAVNLRPAQPVPASSRRSEAFPPADAIGRRSRPPDPPRRPGAAPFGSP
jgi:putative membrane protein